MALSDSVGASQVTAAGTAYSSSTGRNFVLAIYCHAFSRQTHHNYTYN
jgi:hypothetical protein